MLLTFFSWARRPLFWKVNDEGEGYHMSLLLQNTTRLTGFCALALVALGAVNGAGAAPMQSKNTRHAKVNHMMNDPLKDKVCQGAERLKELKFNDEFFAPMKGGAKRATTRKGVRCVAEGDILDAQTVEGVKKGTLKIQKARTLKFDDIDAELAAAEDATVEELKEGLREIYGPEIEKETLTAIYFDYTP